VATIAQEAPDSLPDLGRKPWLEVYVDVPNIEMVLREISWPHMINYRRLGRELAAVLPGGPFFLKKVRCFASTRSFDPRTGTGTLGWQRFVHHLRAIAAPAGGIAELTLSHRLPPLRRSNGDWREKGVDVNLAASMMEGACDGRFRTAALVGNDSDYAGLLRKVRKRGCETVWVYVDRQLIDNDYLRSAATDTYCLSRPMIFRCAWR
jgi:uncharacterized LabA/DUF88 family protein